MSAGCSKGSAALSSMGFFISSVCTVLEILRPVGVSVLGVCATSFFGHCLIRPRCILLTSLHLHSSTTTTTTTTIIIIAFTLDLGRGQYSLGALPASSRVELVSSVLAVYIDLRRWSLSALRACSFLERWPSPLGPHRHHQRLLNRKLLQESLYIARG